MSSNITESRLAAFRTSTSIGAVLLSKRIADAINDAINDAAGWKSIPGTLRARARRRARDVEAARVRARVGPKDARAALRGMAAGQRRAHEGDARGAGTWWGNEFNFEGQKARAKAYEGKTFAMKVQARGLHNGLVIIGLASGASLDENKGNHYHDALARV